MSGKSLQVQFIKNNNDIFNIDTLDDDNCAEIFTVASIADTIKNVAFYDLERLLSKNGIMRHHLYAGLIRRTTEEENVVIYHKKNNIPYDPMKINWSQDFIDGEHAPFTKGYDSLEQKMVYKNKAINIFNVLSIKLHRVS